jgi:hypothetical protein
VLGLAPFGSFQAGWIAEHYGVRVAFQVGALVCLLVAGSVTWHISRTGEPEMSEQMDNLKVMSHDTAESSLDAPVVEP